MSAPIVIFSLIVILLVLHDAFETMLLPRRISRQFRFARFFFRTSWSFWSAAAKRIRSVKRRNAFLSQFGPLSFLVLISLWASGLIVGFACLHWALGTALRPPEEAHGLTVYLYMSGVIFFTLGFGDVTPAEPFGRFLAVCETGLGFAFLAVVISYLPVLYQAFSHREVTISLLDARAGSPPSAGQLLMRFARYRDLGSFDRFLEEWEEWAAEVLESHVSFPLLSFYRSQHDNQSWLAAMTLILDASALVIASVKENDSYQAQLTFAMARHAVVDLAQIYHVRHARAGPGPDAARRTATTESRLEERRRRTARGDSTDQKLTELRLMYEPFVNALAGYFVLGLPTVLPELPPVDNWQTRPGCNAPAASATSCRLISNDDHAE